MAAAALAGSQVAAQPAAKAKGPTAVPGVTVKGAAAGEGIQAGIDRRSYGVASDLQTSTGSIADALRNIPSVAVDVQGNLSLRGDANVTVMIDGKASGQFRGPGAAQALQALPADQIERVEVITNPSAAFSPDGAAGIINLITKRNRKPGTSGSVRANLGSAGRYNLGASGAYKAGKVSLSGDLTVRHDVFKATIADDRVAVVPGGGGGVVASRNDYGQSGHYDTQTVRLSADYDLDARTRISGEVRGSTSEFSTATTDRLAQSGAFAAAYERTGGSNTPRDNIAATATVTRRFKGEGHELVASLSRERTSDDRRRTQATVFTLPVARGAFQGFQQETVQDQWRLKADYSRPLAGGATLKAGYDLQVEDHSYDNSGAVGTSAAGAAADPTQTNLFLYKQTVHALYGTYQKTSGRLTVQGGVRLEDVILNLDQATTGQARRRETADLYPTLHLSYRLDERQELTASYSRRVQRPHPPLLNPFRTYDDPNIYRSGNPDLKPQQTAAYEAGYQFKAGGKTYLSTLYYRRNTHGMTQFVTVLDGGALLLSVANLTDSVNAGLELVVSGRLSRKLTYSASSNLYWLRTDASNLGLSERRSGWTGSGRASLNWQATAKDFVQASANLSGKRFLAQGEQDAYGSLNLGYRHSFSDRLSVVATAQDILSTNRDHVVLETGALRERITTVIPIRAAYVGVSYSFGGAGKKAREPGFDFSGGAGP